MTMRVAHLTLLWLLLTVFLAAASPDRLADNGKLLGTWKSTLTDNSSQTMTFVKDGTFHSEMKGVIKKTFSGMWSFDGKILVQKIKESKPPGGEGVEVKSLVKELTDTRLVFQQSPDDPDSVVEFKKISE